MPHQLFEQPSGLNVPDLDGLVVTAREKLVSEDLQAVNPTYVSLVHLAIARFQAEGSDNRVAASHEDVLVSHQHGLDGFLASNERLLHLVGFKVDYAHHLVPRGGKHHVHRVVDGNLRYWVCKLEDCLLDASLSIPLSDCAVVGS